MNLEESKAQFIQTWGALGSNWGINRTMAQIHALLLISPEALSTEDIMEGLNISRGNTNMNTRELIAWGLVYKELKSGERKEYFVAEKDIWEVVKCIIRERKKRELEPMLKALDNLGQISGSKKGEDYENYMNVLNDIQDLSKSANTVLSKFADAEKNWFLKKFLKLFM